MEVLSPFHTWINEAKDRLSDSQICTNGGLNSVNAEVFLLNWGCCIQQCQQKSQWISQEVQKNSEDEEMTFQKFWNFALKG